MRPITRSFWLILALTSAALAEVAHAQFATRVNQVEVYAAVTDASGRAVRDLPREAFRIFENDKPQEISTFVAREFPASVALAIDRSFSMAGKPLTMARTAGHAFIGSLRPDDRAMVVGISGEVEILAPLTSDRGTLFKALANLEPWSSTSLHDALIKSLGLLEGESGRRAIVILSDGEDRYSTATAADVLARARISDVLIYPIAIAKRRAPLFAELAAVTGGRSFHLKDPQELTATLRTVAADLRSQYLIGYAPSDGWHGEGTEWRSIKVAVDRPGLKIRARSGYSTR